MTIEKRVNQLERQLPTGWRREVLLAGGPIALARQEEMYTEALALLGRLDDETLDQFLLVAEEYLSGRRNAAAIREWYETIDPELRAAHEQAIKQIVNRSEYQRCYMRHSKNGWAIGR